MSRYLVTGGAGFIGSHLTVALVRAGHQVRILDDLSTGNLANLHGVASEVLGGDVRDPVIAARAVDGMDGVFHLAALGSVSRSLKDPEATLSVNVGGTESVLTAARTARVARVVYASSSSVYGAAGGDRRCESDEPRPLSPYAQSKLAGEKICLAAAASFAPEVVCLRYFNVYGPRQDPSSQYAAAIPTFIARFLGGVPAVIYGDGRQTRDFTYVDDIVAGTMAAMTAPTASGRVLNIAAGGRITILDLVELIRDIVGSGETEHVAPRAGEPRHSAADISRAADVLGYRSRWSLTAGLRETVQWHLDPAEVSQA